MSESENDVEEEPEFGRTCSELVVHVAHLLSALNEKWDPQRMEEEAAFAEAVAAAVRCGRRIFGSDWPGAPGLSELWTVPAELTMAWRDLLAAERVRNPDVIARARNALRDGFEKLHLVFLSKAIWGTYPYGISQIVWLKDTFYSRASVSEHRTPITDLCGNLVDAMRMNDFFAAWPLFARLSGRFRFELYRSATTKSFLKELATVFEKATRDGRWRNIIAIVHTSVHQRKG
ncbi:hypothetical protein [Thermosulfurimonas sp. F29]|uniref:hypothetical protein n=1 Tax=Thermosulfurimonas sp. F29 TaxID=2867247 RepID=UPI001C83327F|nr:hypothetical protein [Thermosulfurimonas sp. F29]MBX6423332.1 hypothetical protein [Thermosulfurimonas sp. F29]